MSTGTATGTATGCSVRRRASPLLPSIEDAEVVLCVLCVLCVEESAVAFPLQLPLLLPFPRKDVGASRAAFEAQATADLADWPNSQ